MTFEDELRAALVRRTREDLAHMRSALAEGDYGSLRRLGHRLHGAAGALDLEALALAGRDIDRCAAAGDANGASDAVLRLTVALEAAAARIAI